MGLSPFGCAYSPYAVTPRPFLVFDSLLYRHKPSTESMGLLPIRALERFWAPGESTDRVNEVGTRAEAAKLGDYDGLVYIDIEHWPVSSVPPQVVDDTIAKLSRVADVIHSSRTRNKIGYYSVLPERIYWPIIQHDQTALAAWRKTNQQTEKIAEHVDVIFPSLYTFYNDPKGWALYAKTMLVEARRYGKPVYAFLWPEFESSDSRLKNKSIPAEFWRQELELCHEFADGIVLWGGWQKDWDEQAPWWQVTKEFLKETASVPHE